jgi:hypothetical protein
MMGFKLALSTQWVTAQWARGENRSVRACKPNTSEYFLVEFLCKLLRSVEKEKQRRPHGGKKKENLPRPEMTDPSTASGIRYEIKRVPKKPFSFTITYTRPGTTPSASTSVNASPPLEAGQAGTDRVERTRPRSGRRHAIGLESQVIHLRDIGKVYASRLSEQGIVTVRDLVRCAARAKAAGEAGGTSWRIEQEVLSDHVKLSGRARSSLMRAIQDFEGAFAIEEAGNDQRQQ